MKTILVPTDFSNAAMNAAEYAVNFAKEIKANILLLHTYNVPVAVANDVPIMIPTAEELQKENEKLLKKEAARLKKKTAIEIKYKAKIGLAVDEILEEGKHVSLIVMGKSASGKLMELLGSVTTATLQKATVPLIVVPEKVSYKKPQSIVLASDYDPSTNEHAVDFMNKLAKLFKSKVYVVNVKHRKEEVSVESTIAEVKLETQLKGSEHFYYFPEHKDVVEGINEFIKNKKADMVAVIPHHYSLMEKVFHRSFSKKMAFHTHVPLLVLPDNHKKIDMYFF